MSNQVGMDASRLPPGIAPSQAQAKPAGPVRPEAHQRAHGVPLVAASRPSPVAVPDKADLRVNLEEMRKSLQEAITRLNEQMKQNGRNLNFSIDEVVDRTVVTVKNSQTGEVIRQIPDETVLRVAHHIEALKGILLNESI
jgi:flagellar protein FlaG